jgi:hypothetical protein
MQGDAKMIAYLKRHDPVDWHVDGRFGKAKLPAIKTLNGYDHSFAVGKA